MAERYCNSTGAEARNLCATNLIRLLFLLSCVALVQISLLILPLPGTSIRSCFSAVLEVNAFNRSLLQLCWILVLRVLL